MTAVVASINPLVLPLDSPVVRSAPRPPELQPTDYHQQFDAHTVFFDAFWQGDDVVLSGPPLRNLKGLLPDHLQLDGRVVPVSCLQLSDLYKIQQSRILQAVAASTLQLPLPWQPQPLQTGISPSHLDWFAGRRVLLTLSKDNPLVWLQDWVHFHVRHHGVDAVLVYDNASTAYTPQALLQAISGVAGLKAVVVVPWNFPYGPQGGIWAHLPQATQPVPWDSDFTQYGALEHAHQRFLAQAEGVINADVDELLLCDAGGGIFEYLHHNHLAGVRYQGRWIENTGPTPEPHFPRYADFAHYNPARARSKPKWTVLPAREPSGTRWEVHGIAGLHLPDHTAHVSHRHYMAISLHWKTDRSPRLPYDPAIYIVDAALQAAHQSLTETIVPALPHHAALQAMLQQRQLTGRLRYATHVGRNHDWLFVETPKAACTTIKWLLAELDGCEVPRSHSGRITTLAMTVHQRNRYSMANLLDLPPTHIETLLTSNKVVRFCVVRNPYARLVSAWADKIRQQEPSHAHLWAAINAHTGQPPDVCPSFTHFVQWLCQTQNPQTCDPHWRSQTALLLPDLLHYTHVLHTETLATDLQPVLDQIAPGQCATQLLQRHRYNEALPVPDWRHLYTKHLASWVADFYQPDWNTYGYAQDSWRSTASDTDAATLLAHWQQHCQHLEQTALNAIRNRNQVIASLTSTTGQSKLSA